MTTDENPLRNVINLFRVGHLYTYVKRAVAHSELMKPEKVFSIWLARAEQNYPDWLVVDRNDYVNATKTELCLVPITNREEIADILLKVSDETIRKIYTIARSWGWRPKKDDEKEDDTLKPEDLISLNCLVSPVPRLKNPEYLREVNWKLFVDNLVAYRTEEKDITLKLTHRSRLLRGIDVSINPHGIECTNGGLGKSTFYDIVGENFGKVTASAFLGFAKSPQEVYVGVIDSTDVPIGIDQIESQSAPQIMRFMFNALESGEDTVIGGAVKFKVHTASIFTFLANAIGADIDQTKSFANFIDHISFNPTIGRRIGLIVYGNSFTKIKKKPSPDVLKEWREKVSEFRAVEEFCWQKLREIVHSKEIWSWLNMPIEGYDGQVQHMIDVLDDDTIKTLILEHAFGAQVRIRGAALYASLADHLADIALNNLDMDALVDDAEQYLSDYVEINIASIGRICKEWAKEKSAQISMVYRNLPDYMQEIVSAVELNRREHPEQIKYLIVSLNYQPGTSSYPRLHACIRKLANRKDTSRLLDRVKKHFGFDLMKNVAGEWEVTLLERKPILEVKILGKFGDEKNRFDEKTTVGDRGS